MWAWTVSGSLLLSHLNCLICLKTYTVALSDEALYAVDTGNRRTLRAALSYEVEETAHLPESVLPARTTVGEGAVIRQTRAFQTRAVSFRRSGGLQEQEGTCYTVFLGARHLAKSAVVAK